MTDVLPSPVGFCRIWIRELQTRPNSHLPAWEAPKDQNKHVSAPAEGQQHQQQQPKWTSDATSLLRLYCRTSICHLRKGIVDVASRVPTDEDRGCCCRPFWGYLSGKKRHININFWLWLTSRWPWDKRLVVPGLTGQKSLCVCLETQEI